MMDIYSIMVHVRFEPTCDIKLDRIGTNIIMICVSNTKFCTFLIYLKIFLNTHDRVTNSVKYCQIVHSLTKK